MNLQRELIHLICRLPESDQATALNFLQVLKAKNHPTVQQLQQAQQAELTQLQQQLIPGTRQEMLEMAGQAVKLTRYFMNRADAGLVLQGGLEA
ncbi:MAG: hypothetical protein R3E95_22525 [Thiolinea sp.]